MDDIEHFENFRTHMREENLRIEQMDGDGNCLFRALSFLTEGHQDRHTDIRKMCCDYIWEHKDLFSPSVDNCDVETHVAKMRLDGTWGGHLELTAFASFSEYNVRVHDESRGTAGTVKGQRDELSHNGVLHLAYIGRGHYNALVEVHNMPEESESSSFSETDNEEEAHQSSAQQTPCKDSELYREDLRRFLSQIWNTTLDKPRVLILCIPKLLIGETPLEKLRNESNVKTTVLYTLSFDGSPFLRDIREDGFFHRHFNVYSQTVLPPIGVYDQQNWIARLGVFFILHTNMERPINNVTYEFFFDPREVCLITCAIIRQLEHIRYDIEDMVPKLEANKLFSLDPEGLPENDDDFKGFFSLLELEPFPMQRYGPFTDHYSGWSICGNYEYMMQHRLGPLLTRNPMSSDRYSLIEAVSSILTATIASNNRMKAYTVYVALIVTAETTPPKLDELFRLWTDRSANFSIYIGVTVNSDEHGIRREHTLPGYNTSISDKMTGTSSLFLVNQQTFEDYNMARQLEAILIALSMYEQRTWNRKGRPKMYELLNLNRENMWFCSVTEDIIDLGISFVEDGGRIFRLPGENFDSVEDEDFQIGNYVIQKQVESTYFTNLGQEL